MKRFILHVGFHKTATSSIQQTLALNLDQLAEQGYRYPIFEYNGLKITNHSIPFYSTYCKEPQKYNMNIMNGYCENVKDVNAHYMQQIENIMLINKDIIISGEDISVLPLVALQLIRDKILSNGFKLEVYCSVRQPYSFLCSELQERIKAGSTTLDTILVPKITSNVKKLKAVFDDKIIFSNFESDCEIGNPVNAFLRRIGVDSSGLIIVSNNEGLGNISTRFYAHLNKTHPILINGKVNEKGRRRFLNNFDTEKFLLTKDEFQKIEYELIRESDELGEILGNNYVDKAIKFSKPIIITKLLAEKIHNDIKQDGLLSLPILGFVNKHRGFDMVEFISSEDTDLLENAGLICKDTNSVDAIKLIEKAKSLKHETEKLSLKQACKSNKQPETVFLEVVATNSSLCEFWTSEYGSIESDLFKRLTYFISEKNLDITSHTQLTDVLFHKLFAEKDKEIFINLIRDVSLKIEEKSLMNAFRLMALAKILRPGGQLIINKLKLFEEKLLNNLTIGIGVITYNRVDLVKNAVKKINQFTSKKYQLVVADDGSNDGTAQWCFNNSTHCISGENKGVVWNKNRALYYLNTVLKCDVTIILEDDCYPAYEGWQVDWVLSAVLWGHINFAHKRIIKKSGTLISGDGSYLSPFIAKLVTGQCTACSAAAIKHVGYLNSRFVGYGAGHVEWTEKFVFHGYNGLRTEVGHVFPAINQGVVSEDAPTYKDQAQLDRNKKLKITLKKDNTFKFPWKNTAEKSIFLKEMSDVLSGDDYNNVRNKISQINLRKKVSGRISKVVGRLRGMF